MVGVYLYNQQIVPLLDQMDAWHVTMDSISKIIYVSNV